MFEPRNSSGRFCTPIAAAFAIALGVSPVADARITNIQLNGPFTAFAGASFGTVGTYQYISGIAKGELSATDPHNTIITDIALADTNANGKVPYTIKFALVRPADLTKGNHRVVFEVPNRGGAQSISNLNGQAVQGFPGTTNGTNPSFSATISGAGTTAASAGTGFLMRQGYTILVSSWDQAAGAFNPTNGTFSIDLPLAHDPQGSTTPITGPAMEEFVIDSPTASAQSLTYPANSLVQDGTTVLTYRVRTMDPPVVVPLSDWQYVNNTSVRLTNGASFKRGLYEFRYIAKDPVVAGIGLAALRDIVTFLKYSTQDDGGVANPMLSGGVSDIQKVYTTCNSQPCRTLHDYLHLGFNADEAQDRVVIDGILNWIGGADGIFLNYRFAQPGRTKRQHIARHYPEGEFPWNNNLLTDPITGKTDGRLERCKLTHTCPKSIEAHSENEYYAKAGSNLHFDRVKGDLPDATDENGVVNTRSFLLSTLPHGAGTGAGICQQGQNPLLPHTVLRALLGALDAWVTNGTPPPPSQVPKFAKKELMPALPQVIMGFPNIPARTASGNDTGLPVVYNGRQSTGDYFNYGPRFSQGILDIVPPILIGAPYMSLVPATDSDGNDKGGLRLPDVTVPTATYTGWATRNNPDISLASNDGCDASGQKIPFAKTAADRAPGGGFAGDPRPSLAERYVATPTMTAHQVYVQKVTDAANALMAAGYLLQEDVNNFITAANAAAVP